MKNNIQSTFKVCDLVSFNIHKSEKLKYLEDTGVVTAVIPIPRGFMYIVKWRLIFPYEHVSEALHSEYELSKFK